MAKFISICQKPGEGGGGGINNIPALQLIVSSRALLLNYYWSVDTITFAYSRINYEAAICTTIDKPLFEGVRGGKCSINGVYPLGNLCSVSRD